MRAVFYVSCVVCFGLSVPFYSPRGGSRLQGVGARVGLVRGMARIFSRLSILAWPRPVLFKTYLAMMARAPPELISCMPPGIGSRIRLLVCCSRCRVGSGWSANFHRSTVPWEGARGLEGLAA